MSQSGRTFSVTGRGVRWLPRRGEQRHPRCVGHVWPCHSGLRGRHLTPSWGAIDGRPLRVTLDGGFHRCLSA